MLSLGEVLAMDVCQRGQPRVLAGADRLDSPVRWVHAVELTDVARLLRGGELVLSTGIALPDDDVKLAAYVAELADTGTAGLAVELGRRYAGSLPRAMVSAAAAAGLPLIAFEREVPFVEITEAVHARIIDAQLAELRASERLHEMFTELSVAGASADEIVRQVATLAGRPVILADLSHRVLAFEPAGADPTRLLAGFAARSRSVVLGGRTTFDDVSGWLVTPVGARGEDWGRVILVCSGPPTPGDTMLIERAATTLALGRLLIRHQESLERQAHRTLISGIIARAHADPAEAEMRSRALGVPVDGRQLLTLVLRVGEPSGIPGISAHARVLEAADVLAEACRGARIPALVGTLDDLRAGAMLSLAPTAVADETLGLVVGKLRDRLGPMVIGVGAVADSIRDVRRSFLEAGQVADAVEWSPQLLPFYRLPDLHLRGLLHLLRDDARLRTFTERELGPLLEHARGAELVEVLGAFLVAGGNKAAAAKSSHLARPTFYERLRRIERILAVNLDSAETRTSLHVALLALRAGVDPETSIEFLKDFQNFYHNGSGTSSHRSGLPAASPPGQGARAGSDAWVAGRSPLPRGSEVVRVGAVGAGGYGQSAVPWLAGFCHVWLLSVRNSLSSPARSAYSRASMLGWAEIRPEVIKPNSSLSGTQYRAVDSWASAGSATSPASAVPQTNQNRLSCTPGRTSDEPISLASWSLQPVSSKTSRVAASTGCSPGSMPPAGSASPARSVMKRCR